MFTISHIIRLLTKIVLFNCQYSKIYFFHFFLGPNHVIVHTFFPGPGNGYDLKNFRLVAHSPSFKLSGILCERGNMSLGI